MGVAAVTAEAGVAIVRWSDGLSGGVSCAAGRRSDGVEMERVACRRVINRRLSINMGKSNRRRIGKNKEVSQFRSSSHADRAITL